jgi:copper oxidase (laccase) domain-containing protein
MPMDTITSSFKNPESKISNADEEKSLAENGFFWREKDGVRVLVSRVLEENGFANAFSTRLAGFDDDSSENIFENRRRFLGVFDKEYQLATAWQVHGDGVKIVRSFEDAADDKEKFDALASNVEGVLVGVKTADCVPVLLGDAKTGAFAAVHAGWRGTAQSIVVKTLEKM